MEVGHKLYGVGGEAGRYGRKVKGEYNSHLPLRMSALTEPKLFYTFVWRKENQILCFSEGNCLILGICN